MSSSFVNFRQRVRILPPAPLTTKPPSNRGLFPTRGYMTFDEALKAVSILRDLKLKPIIRTPPVETPIPPEGGNRYVIHLDDHAFNSLAQAVTFYLDQADAGANDSRKQAAKGTR